LNLVRSHLQLNEHQKAVSLVHNANFKSETLSDDILLHFAAIFEKANLAAEANQFRLAYLTKEPKAFYPFIQAAISFLKANDTKKAEELLQKGIFQTSLYRLTDFKYPLYSPALLVNVSELRENLIAASKSRLPSVLLTTAEALITYQATPATSEKEASEAITDSATLLQSTLQNNPDATLPMLLLAAISMRQDKQSEVAYRLGKIREHIAPNLTTKLLNIQLNIARNLLSSSKQELPELNSEKGMTLMKLLVKGNFALAEENRTLAQSYYQQALELDSSYFPALLKIYQLNSDKS
jgi:hypothetical protein